MIVEYRIPSRNGDLQAGPEILGRPFLLKPCEAHPFLTLEDYFDALRRFSLQLLAHLAFQSEPGRMIIRSEKHGALYHIASTEFFFEEGSRKFAVSAALSERGKACLSREETLLRKLGEDFRLAYLPTPFLKREVSAGGKASLSMMATGWFEDYHEWHLDSDRSRRIYIWDQKRGTRLASDEEASCIYEEASKILTLYYDPESFRQIRPWHHAAGDFVVSTEGKKTEVRLTTVRGYEPLELMRGAGPLNPVIGLVYFFLDLTIKMRIDKTEGTKEVIWADSFCLRPVVEGFFEALRIVAGQARHPLGDPEYLLRLFQTFSLDEVNSLFRPLLKHYESEDPGDYPVIEANLGVHAESLWRIIRRFPG